MCVEEMNLTLYFQSLQYHRNREKCFSHNLDWIINRVMNFNFNNSNHVIGRYKHLLEFTFDSSNGFIINNNEWKTNIRLNNLIKIISIKEYNEEF
jgi:hypothetical protein